MRYLAFTIFLNISCLNLFADKQIILNCLENLKVASTFEKSEIYKNLSLAYYHDQDLEKAFKTFLIALDLSSDYSGASMEESTNASHALKMYLEHNGKPLSVVAKQIIERFSSSYHETQDDHLLGLILALAHANLSQFEEFFCIFYRSYVLTPDHFLKYKTRAILNIKLFDRARTVEEKEIYRQEIAINLNKALQASSEDTSLNRLAKLFSREKNKNHLAEIPKEKNGN